MPEDTPAPARRQMNVRLPVDLIEAIDARRARLDLSRDQWVERALRHALTSTTPTSAAATAPGRRTVRRQN